MRALFALIAWLACLAGTASAGGVQMGGEGDATHLGPMEAPPWRASADEQAAADHSGFEVCEQIVKRTAAPIGSITEQAYTTSQRWGKILRVKIAFGSGGPPGLVTCWAPAEGDPSIVFKIDDGEP